jgi:ubiquinol-cytochrome c reductase subunit 9
MSIGATIYNTFFKSSSRYFLTLVVGAFALERVVDGLADNIFDSINRGKQWKDIQNMYVKNEAVEDEE